MGIASTESMGGVAFMANGTSDEGDDIEVVEEVVDTDDDWVVISTDKTVNGATAGGFDFATSKATLVFIVWVISESDKFILSEVSALEVEESGLEGDSVSTFVARVVDFVDDSVSVKRPTSSVTTSTVLANLRKYDTE